MSNELQITWFAHWYVRVTFDCLTTLSAPVHSSLADAASCLGNSDAAASAMCCSWAATLQRRKLDKAMHRRSEYGACGATADRKADDDGGGAAGHAPRTDAGTLAPGMLAKLFGRQASGARDGSDGEGEIAAGAARRNAGAPHQVASSDGSALRLEMTPVSAGADAQGAGQNGSEPDTGLGREAHTLARLDPLRDRLPRTGYSWCSSGSQTTNLYNCTNL